MTTTLNRLALDDLFSLVYEDLRRLAGCVLRNDRSARISPTTLVNEVWIKLSASPGVADTSVLHFRRIAGRAMRQVLVDAARRRGAHIHGGGYLHVTLDPSIGSPGLANARDILALDAALEILKSIAPRQVLLVEARFFGGFDCGECAAILGVSEATVMRDWRSARAWLAREIKLSLAGPHHPPVDLHPGA